MNIEPYQISIFLAIVCALVELIYFSFIFIGFASGMIVIALLEYITGNFNWNRDIFVFSISSGLFIYSYRKFLIKNKPEETIMEKDINNY